MNLNNGNIEFEKDVTEPSGIISVDQDIVIVPSVQRWITALDIEGNNFEDQWVFDSDIEIGEQLKYMGTGAAIDGADVFFNGISLDNSNYYVIHVYKYSGNLANDMLISGNEHDYCNTPVLYENRLYLTYEKGIPSEAIMRCFSKDFNTLFWTYSDFPDQDILTPVAHNNRLYIGDYDGNVTCLYYFDGDPYFSKDVGQSLEIGMSINNSSLIALSTSELNLINIDNGDLINSVDLNSDHYTPPVVYGNKIYFANENEELYCVSSEYPPECNFWASPISGTAPLLVQFDPDIEPGATPISSYFWDFGDGNTSTTEEPSHTYDSPGLYTVSLTINSPTGGDTKVRPNYITVNDPPHLIFIPDNHTFEDTYLSDCRLL